MVFDVKNDLRYEARLFAGDNWAAINIFEMCFVDSIFI
jgi:hypothetical protein